MIFINPGSGPVADAYEHYAAANIAVFIQDLQARGHTVSLIGPSTKWQLNAPGEDGRWTYTILAEGTEHEVEMPGLPIDQVHFMRRPDQNIWDFPRLYVDGSSWVWLYALDECVPEKEEDSTPCAYCGKPTPPERQAAAPWQWPGRGLVTNCLDCAGEE